MLEYTRKAATLKVPEGWGVTETDGGVSREYVNQGYAFELTDGEQQFYFIPKSAIDKGIVAYDRQYYFPNVLRPDFLDKFQGESVTLDQIGDPRLARDVSQFYEDTQGVLVSKEVRDELFKNMSSYDLNTYKLDGVKLGPITGVGQKDGQNVYVTAASGRENPQGWIDWNEDKNESYRNTRWYDPGNKLLRGLGYGLIALGTGGLAGFGPLAAPSAGITTGTAGATAGTAGGIVGTPGVSTIYPVAAPSVGVSSLAPISTAAAVPAANLAFPALEVAPTFTPAPKSLQAALPGLGVETAASAAPFTAVPGSFQAALPSLGIASSPFLATNVAPVETGMGVTDALRAANTVKNLLGAQQNPIVPQQARPQMAARGVDTLALPQLTARTPGVSSLLAPAQLQQRYQPTLLPNVFSLLG